MNSHLLAYIKVGAFFKDHKLIHYIGYINQLENALSNGTNVVKLSSYCKEIQPSELGKFIDYIMIYYNKYTSLVIKYYVKSRHYYVHLYKRPTIYNILGKSGEITQMTEKMIFTKILENLDTFGITKKDFASKYCKINLMDEYYDLVARL